MTTIEVLAGTSIHDTAAMLVACAPARATFNGIHVRARFATTRPIDVVREWERKENERSVIFRNSAEGKAQIAAVRAKRG